MSQLTIKLGPNITKIVVPKTNSPEDMASILECSLKCKDRIVGVTDEQGRFYDLDFLHKNLKILKKQQLDLVTVREANDDNMSFGNCVNMQLQTICRISTTKKAIQLYKHKYSTKSPRDV